MRFDTDGPKVAGSSMAILSEPDVAEVYGLFGDLCIEYYFIDIREKKSFMTPVVMRQVRSFVREYGVEDAKKIVRRMFEQPRCGKRKGQVIGTAIFSKKFRWLANQMLIEKEEQDRFGDSASWSKW